MTGTVPTVTPSHPDQPVVSSEPASPRLVDQDGGPVDLTPTEIEQGPISLLHRVERRRDLDGDPGRGCEERLTVGPGVGRDAAQGALEKQVALVVEAGMSLR